MVVLTSSLAMIHSWLMTESDIPINANVIHLYMKACRYVIDDAVSLNPHKKKKKPWMICPKDRTISIGLDEDICCAWRWGYIGRATRQFGDWHVSMNYHKNCRYENEACLYQDTRTTLSITNTIISGLFCIDSH